MSSAPIVFAFIAAIAGSLGAYLAATRKLSGKIGTSDADKLWDASEKMREEYRERLNSSERRTAEVESRVAELERKNSDLAKENVELHRETHDQEETIRRLRHRVAALEEQVHDLHAELAAKGVVPDAGP